MSEIKLLIDDAEFNKWQSYEVESDMMTPSDAFSLTAPNNDGEMAQYLYCGASVKLVIDDKLILNGNIDELNYITDESGSVVHVIGRDKFSFLYDCSADLETLNNQTLATLAETLASDWIGSWFVVGTPTVINKVKVDPGETVLNVLERIAEKDNLLIWAEADGSGTISKPNYTQAPSYNIYHYKRTNPSRLRNNVIDASVTFNSQDRYSTISVFGSTGNTKSNYATSSRSKFSASDDEIGNDRKLIITDGDIKNNTQAKNLAEYERDKRKFNGTILEYTVRGHYGFLGDKKNLWTVDTIVDVEDELAFCFGNYYLTRRRFRGGSEGAFTDIELHPSGVWLA